MRANIQKMYKNTAPVALFDCLPLPALLSTWGGRCINARYAGRAREDPTCNPPPPDLFQEKQAHTHTLTP